MSLLLEKIKESDLTSVAIFSGAGVDPDGLASSLAMKMIVEKFGGSAKCFYRGTFNRPQNKTVREVLALNVTPDSEFNRDDFSTIISVDGPAETCPTMPHFIIDHHKSGAEPPVGGVDIRQIGSCSAILWEYAMAAEIDFDSEDGKKLATALVIGILTDTNTFKDPKSSDLDSAAAGFCLQKKDYKSFLAIQNFVKPRYYSDMYADGWANKVWEGTVLVSGLGAIPEGRSGIISDLAEKYGETEGVNLSVVVAMVGNEIVMSVRSSNNSIAVDEFVRTFGNGGGKSGAGVARIQLPEPLFSNVGDEHRQSVFDSFFKIIVSKALEYAGDGAAPNLVDKE